ncbi:heat shock factor protein-like isoform X2 [Cylas formicarius]|uniref:heat shock factor protein-like isoform X2 n=1 Tax=Cylas formicarius TaxID=197179 RepID=UPI0029585DC2|nr:heat shock factor protein-like isoform X2 [Cylas formicarius]
MQPGAIENANVPAFLGKLWKMVDDPATDHVIHWGPNGNSFIIRNQFDFWCELLPAYYKHNNMSSFVRQLNMYGFHKIASIDSGSMDAERDEIQFYHPCFQKGQPEKLKNIKRKVTTTRAQDPSNQDDLTKVLTEVKQLRGRQTNIDSQLTAMKQENTVLWRELALLRQKHLKQQQIVNKLIQFLVTLVQPTAQRMSVGVKRRIPLMLHESPTKKMKGKKSEDRPSGENGPTIHELDADIDINPEDLLAENVEVPLIDSPATSGNVPEPLQNDSTASTVDLGTTNIDLGTTDVDLGTTEVSQDALNNDFIWDKPEFVHIDGPSDLVCDNEEDLINTLQNNAASNEQIFLNPNSRDALISNLTQPQTSSAAAGMSLSKKTVSEPNTNDQTNPSKGMSGEDLDVHLDNTQSELDQLKDMLNGCTSFDANALLGVSKCPSSVDVDANGLLGLFSDNEPDFELPESNGLWERDY